MRSLIPALAIAIALCASAAPQKQKKPPEVVVLEAKARRDDGKILVDGRVRTAGEKAVRGLVVYFDLRSPEGGVITSEKIVLEEEPLEPGQERSWHAETSENVRAVRFTVRAMDFHERELRVENEGPFTIE